jgi:beta-galactosidase
VPRTVTNLNREWRFLRGDAEGAESPQFDDSRWGRIGLPHTFDLPYFRTPEFYVGFGWYRKRVELDSNAIGDKRMILEFDGVFQAAEVFINGRRAGGHRGGYTGFSIDITDAVVAGGNVIAIRVNNNWNPQLAPRAGEHVFSGGIYRDVRLVVTNDAHIPWCGVSVTTPTLSSQRASIRIETEVTGRRLASSRHKLATTILDPAGNVVASKITPIRSTTSPIDQQFEIDRPLLWHPDHPHRYQAISEIIVDDVAVDHVETTFGVRWFEWTPDRGFFLNGEHLYLRGANAHQDHAGWGIAITRAACERDVRLIKEAGFNFVRGAHYPHHPAFADACDRLGVIFWSECVFWGKGGFGPDGYWNASAYPTNLDDAAGFERSCLDQLEEMIRINRNHPSIVVWSMTNEAFFTYHLDRAKGLMKKMVDRSRELDPTRPAAIGGAQRGGVDRIGDVAGFNGDGARLFVDPGVPNMVSEYGAISKPHDAFEPFFGDLQQERFAWRAGEAIWCGFDYGSIAGRQGLKGIVDHQRVPKQSWHWYRQHNLNIKPPAQPGESTAARLQLDADKQTINGTDATDDVQIIVTVLDEQGRHVQHSPVVTLAIDSGPGEFPTGRSITFDANHDNTITRGRAATAFRSYLGGRTVIRATSPGLGDAAIEIETIGEPRWVESITQRNDDRPYTPPPESEAAKGAMRDAVNVALNRPCRASSESDSHPARLANDGDAETAWLAKEGDDAAIWTLDLEGFYQLASIKLVFPSTGNRRFMVERSEDARAWMLEIDRRQSVNESAERIDVFNPGVVARYLRLTFTHVPPGRHAGLAEVELFGILSAK